MVVEFFANLLDPVLNWTLLIPAWLALLILSFTISLFITIVYKFTTNQVLLKEWREQMKKYRKQMQGARKDPQKMLKVQEKLLPLQQKFMLHSMKPTLITLLPMLILLAWLQAHFAYGAFMPQDDVTLTVAFDLPEVQTDVTITSEFVEQTQQIQDNAAEFSFAAPQSGTYTIDIAVPSLNETVETQLVVGERPPNNVDTYSGVIKSATLGYPKHIVLPIEILGYQPGWLVTYIIFSLPMTLILRKLFGVS